MSIAVPNWLPLGKIGLGKEQWMLVFVGIIAVVIITRGVIPTLNAWRGETVTRLDEQGRTLAILEGELKTIGEDDPAKVRVRIQNEYELLLSQVNEQEQVVRALRGGLVNSDQITVLLARLLEESQGVSLLSIENAGVTPVNSPVVSTGVASTNPATPGTASGTSGGTPLLQAPHPAGIHNPPAATPGPTLYRHGVRMLLKGDYRSLVRYLAHVEQLPWTIYWDEVALVVDKHPVVELAIEFHTLSEQEAWLEIT